MRIRLPTIALAIPPPGSADRLRQVREEGEVQRRAPCHTRNAKISRSGRITSSAAPAARRFIATLTGRRA